MMLDPREPARRRRRVRRIRCGRRLQARRLGAGRPRRPGHAARRPTVHSSSVPSLMASSINIAKLPEASPAAHRRPEDSSALPSIWTSCPIWRKKLLGVEVLPEYDERRQARSDTARGGLLQNRCVFPTPARPVIRSRLTLAALVSGDFSSASASHRSLVPLPHHAAKGSWPCPQSTGHP